VAFRTHVWNDDIAVLARRLAFFSRGVTFVILADESHGELATGSFKKIAHGNDFAPFGLPNFPGGGVLWYNADYPLYVLRQAFPEATHFAMVEFDVSANIDVAAMMRAAQAQQVDLIAHEMADAAPDWGWRPTMEGRAARTLRALIAFIVVSARAVDAMRNARHGIYAAKTPEQFADWPYCEAFIPSVIAGLEDARLVELSNFARLPNFECYGHRHLHDPEVSQLGTINHPVMGERMLIDRIVAPNASVAAAVFDPQSPLRRQLCFCKPEDFAEKLFNLMKLNRSREKLFAYMELARKMGWPVGAFHDSIATFKPALVSSTCNWSRSQDPAIEAQGGNNGIINGDYGFHTAAERDPWWQVDLEDFYAVERVVLFNRLEAQERAARVSVSSSADGREWVLQAVKLDDAVFGGADGNPHAFAFSPPFRARFVRVTMIGEDYFHLDEVEIYGERLST
jgi:hypothetical protein